MYDKSRMLTGALVACTLLSSAPAFAQTDTMQTAAVPPHGFWITTPAPDFTAGAGKAISIPLTVINDTETPHRAALTLSGVPDGWTHGAGHYGRWQEKVKKQLGKAALVLLLGVTGLVLGLSFFLTLIGATTMGLNTNV